MCSTACLFFFLVESHGLGHLDRGRIPPVLLPVPSASFEVVCAFALGCLTPFCVCQLKAIDGGDEVCQGSSGVDALFTSRPETGPKHCCFAIIQHGAGEVLLPSVPGRMLDGVLRHCGALPLICLSFMPLTSLCEGFLQGAKLLVTFILRAVSGWRLKIDTLQASVTCVPRFSFEQWTKASNPTGISRPKPKSVLLRCQDATLKSVLWHGLWVYVYVALLMHLDHTTKHRNPLQQIQEDYHGTSSTAILILFQQLCNNASPNSFPNMFHEWSPFSTWQSWLSSYILKIARSEHWPIHMIEASKSETIDSTWFGLGWCTWLVPGSTPKNTNA